MLLNEQHLILACKFQIASKDKKSPTSADEDKEHSTADKTDDSDSDVDSEERPRKRKTGKHLFSSLEKSPELILPDDIDDTQLAALETSTDKERSANNSDCEILDTSMFKANKAKPMGSSQLSKILSKNSANRPRATARAQPDDAISLSSDSDLEIEPISKTAGDDGGDGDGDESKSKRVARYLRPDQLACETKRAQKDENERVKRLQEKNDRLTQIIASQKETSSQGKSQTADGSDEPAEVLLDHHTKDDVKIVVHKNIVKHLKPHQIDGIRFMYDCCYGNVNTINKHVGSGCILAHCMGLGKTLQLIALLHTVISYRLLRTNKVLVICPKSTIMNWKEEIERWLSPVSHTKRKLKLLYFPDNW